jgi:hypothetical protein
MPCTGPTPTASVAYLSLCSVPELQRANGALCSRRLGEVGLAAQREAPEVVVAVVGPQAALAPRAAGLALRVPVGNQAVVAVVMERPDRDFGDPARFGSGLFFKHVPSRDTALQQTRYAAAAPSPPSPRNRKHASSQR